MSSTPRTAPKGAKTGDGGEASGASAKKEKDGQPAVIVSRVVDVGRDRKKTAPGLAAPAVPPPPPPRAHAGDDEPPTEPRHRSSRPKTPEQGNVFDPVSSPSIEATFERLLGDIDDGFADVLTAPGSRKKTSSRPPPDRVVDESDLSDVRDLFAQLAAKHMRPVRDFMIELRWGEAATSWLTICEPVVKSLRGAAERLVLTQLVAALDGFAAALGAAIGETRGKNVEGISKDGLIAAYARLEEAMPQAFALEMDHTQREGVIVHSLLLQVPGVKRVTIDKLYAAGLSSLDALFGAKARDIAQTAGIDETIAARIVERFKHYEGERRAQSSDATRAEERDRLASLAKRLRYQNDEYERAAAAWSDDARAKKKAMRDARAATLLEINVVLARLGEVERLKSMEKLPFGKKVEALDAFLEEAERTLGAGSGA